MRALGVLALLSAALFFASVPLDMAAPRAGAALRMLALALLVPPALWLGRALAPAAPAQVWAATAAGVASLLWWILSGIAFPWSWEAGYIALSAAWWLGVGGPLRRSNRPLGTFTLVVGAFAAADALVTAAGDRVPFWAFALFGGPKLPLQTAWTVWLGIALLRGRIPRLPEDAQDATPIRAAASSGAMAHDPHAGHEHFHCGCGKMFHSRQELTDHARRLNHKPK